MQLVKHVRHARKCSWGKDGKSLLNIYTEYDYRIQKRDFGITREDMTEMENICIMYTHPSYGYLLSRSTCFISINWRNTLAFTCLQLSGVLRLLVVVLRIAVLRKNKVQIRVNEFLKHLWLTRQVSVWLTHPCPSALSRLTTFFFFFNYNMDKSCISIV